MPSYNIPLKADAAMQIVKCRNNMHFSISDNYLCSVKIMKIIALLSFYLEISFCFSQCENARLYEQFDVKQGQFKAVTFVMDKISINYNSWDLKSDIDTFIRKETYWCIREGDHFKILKEGNLKGIAYSQIYWMDTVAFYNFKSGTFKQKITSNNKYADFGEAFWFLHNAKDTFFMCKVEDTIQLLSNNGFARIGHFENEYGPGSYKNSYTFNDSGILIQFESFYNQKRMLPKFYSKATFSEIKYHQQVPSFIEKKIAHQLKKAWKMYNITRLKKVDTSDYIRVNNKGSVSKLKPAYKYGKAVSLDSVIAHHKVTLVYFWFNGCVPCHQLSPYLIDIYKVYHTKGLEIIGLNNLDKESCVDTCNSQFISYFDQLKNYRTFGVKGYPTVLVFNGKGEIVGNLNGYRNFGISEMEKHIEELLSD